MIPKQTTPESDSQAPPPLARVAAAAAAQDGIQPSSPNFFFSSAAAANPSFGSHRRIAIAVDLSDESAYAVKWAVQNYLRPGDAVILLHVRPTSVLYGADWGSVDLSVSEEAAEEGAGSDVSQQKLEEDFDAFTATKAQDLARPLVEAQIPFKIHIVKDHDMKERLCLEVERLSLSAVIMGSRGFGASRRTGKGRLGSVSDYCVHHCVCPVVVVRDEGAAAGADAGVVAKGACPSMAKGSAEGGELHPVPEEDEYHDAYMEHKDT
uniref:UspA domain-containing protein n=1 Tax=Musa acuminata subsp. malaccensis TaxID=214687 RepID=A0A804KNG1_MUSAM|nr:PREDICTED: universal stress protein PHOS32 [Musa acuminata subsp. malaccensis]